jgi:hypothetical protein
MRNIPQTKATPALVIKSIRENDAGKLLATLETLAGKPAGELTEKSFPSLYKFEEGDELPELTDYAPENLELWKTPDSWFGEPWEGYYVFLGRHRDSDCLAESNFAIALAALGGEDGNMVAVVREGHWLCGWIEWIAIHSRHGSALRAADEMAAAISDYPVLDEEDYLERESEAACKVWRDCYDERERVEYIRERRDQFEFASFADMLGCARGKFFGGYASELLY